MQNFHVKSNCGSTAPKLTNLEIIGHYSIDKNYDYHPDLSQLKYLKLPSDLKHVDYDLNKDYELTKSKAQQDFKLDFLLRWMTDNYFPKSEKSTKPTLPDFVCFRGVLQRIMGTPFEKRDGWIICASKMGKTIYLCNYDTAEKKAYRNNLTDKEKRPLIWGFKFEQYLLADSPTAEPDLSIPLYENEEFCCVFKSLFGTHTLLYGAEMDGINSNTTIKDTLVGKEIEFVELKTIDLHCFTRKGRIMDYKLLTLLKWWMQTYLVGIHRIVVGCKNKNGIVKELKEYSSNDILHLGRGKWSDNHCRRFLNSFLDYVKNTVDKDYKECLYKFSFDLTDIIRIEELDPDCNFKFLTEDFIREASRSRKRSRDDNGDDDDNDSDNDKDKND